MAYALRAFYEQENNFGVTDRVEIYEDGFSGSVIQLGGRRPVFEHEEITGEGTGGILSVHDNKIMMGSLTFEPRIDTAAKKTLIQDISDASPFDFQVRFKRDADTVWYGYPSGRVFSYPEKESYFARILFKDFEILKSIDYGLTDERQHPIETLSELFDYLNFGINIVTNTSWQEEDTTIADDFLNQIYHDTVGLRQYGDSGDEDDVPISVYDALLIVAEPVLLIKQWDGFRVDQLSAKQSPSSTLVSVYNSSGVQQSSTLSDIRQTGYTTVDDGTPSIKVTSENDSYPAVKRARVFYNFRTSESGIQVPSTVTLEESTAETGTITASTGSTVVSGSGTSFLADVNEGDIIWVDQSGELRELGEVASVTDNTNITLTSTANYSVSGVAWHLNARETARYSQDFVSDGTQRIRITGTVRVTGNFGTTSIFGRSRLRSGTYYYNRSTQSWAETEVINKFSTTGTQTEKFGSIGIETTDIPDAADGVLELTLFIAIDNFDTIQNVDITNYEDVTFTIRENTASGNSNGIVHELTQSGGYDTYDFGEDLYGEGVGGALYLPSSYRFGTSDTQLATNWRRRGETPYIGFHRLKLREVLDFQRTRTRKIYADAWGEIEPNSVLVYDSNNYYYVGGVYDGFWRPRYIKVNEQTASDTYVSRLVTGGGGTSGNGSNNPAGGGLTQTVADDLYFRQDENLSEGDPETIRDNIELGEADSPTFDGLNIGSDWLLDTESLSGVNRLSIRSQSGNEDMELFLHPIGTATHARLEVSNDPNLNNYNSIAIESNEVSQRIESRAEGSATILPLQIRVAGDETLSLWTNDVQRVSVGSAGVTLTGALSGTSATFSGDVNMDRGDGRTVVMSIPGGNTGLIYNVASSANYSRFNHVNFPNATLGSRFFGFYYEADGSSSGLRINKGGNVSFQNSLLAGATAVIDSSRNATFNRATVSGGTSGQLRIANSGATTPSEWWWQVRDGGELQLRNQTGDVSTVIYVNASNNNIGIGTAPAEKLHVNGFVRSLSGYKVGSTTVIDSNRDGFLRNLEVSETLEASRIEVDTLRTTLFKPNSISGMGGEFAFTAVTKVVSIDTGADTIVVTDAVFSDNDLLVVSSGTYDDAGFVKVELELTSTGSSVSGGTEYSYSVNSGLDTDIEEGFTVVRAGNNTTPADLIYIDATEGGDSPSIKAYDGISSFADSPLSGGGAISIWELTATGGKIGSLVFDGDEMRNADDTFSFSNAGIKLTSDSSFSSPENNQEIRWNESSGRIGYDNALANMYFAAPSVQIRATSIGGAGSASLINGSDSVVVGNAVIINSPNGWFAPDLPTSAPSGNNQIWNDSGTLKITDPPVSAPSTPTGLALTRSRANSAMKIEWNASSGATSYDLQRSTDDSSWSTIATDTTQTQYLDSLPFSNKGVTYYYRVRSSNSGGDSAYSSSVNSTWNSASNEESILPTAVTFIFSGFGSDDLTWSTPASGNPTSYSIQYAIDTGGGFGAWNSLETAYSGAATSYSLDACSLASNGDDMKLRIAANYSNPTETSAFVESNTEAISGCF